MRGALFALLLLASPAPASLADAGDAAAATPRAGAPAPAAPATPRPAARSARPAPRVWTASDLQALKSERAGNVNYIEVPVSLADEKLAPRGPSGVPSRYAELLAEANRELEKLSREELAGTNPLLRGLAGGKVRPVDEIRADKQKWQERRVLAQQAYDKLQGGAAANARED